jgi:Mitochondrial ATP synthase B chain precursor (ATP-synt_B)
VAGAGFAISKELFVLNEEVVILGASVVFAGYIAGLIRTPYREWADGQIKVCLCSHKPSDTILKEALFRKSGIFLLLLAKNIPRPSRAESTLSVN